MSSQHVEVLDTVAGIEFDRDTFPIHNLHALDYLPQGLYELAMTVRQKEIREVEQRLEMGVPTLSTSFIPGHYGRLVASLFNWFALSLCNYLRLVVLIDIVSRHQWNLLQISRNRETVKQHCAAYTKEVALEVKLWRDKVAAHPALTDPRSDNLAMLQYSVVDSFVFSNGIFIAGFMRYIVDGKEPPVEQWSVTAEYKRLAPRFWNQWTLPPLPEAQ